MKTSETRRTIKTFPYRTEMEIICFFQQFIFVKIYLVLSCNWCFFPFFFKCELKSMFLISACIASRPGQCGRADGYIMEGKELEFYLRKIKAKKGK